MKKTRLNDNHWLLNKPVAHRGLWGGDIPENSLTAYQTAIKRGYPIEIDLYRSSDGVLYCFHDKTLKRMTGAEGRIFEKTSAELNSLRLNGTDCKIPRFDEVLSLAENKTPLLIELKDHEAEDFVYLVAERLKKYRGEFAVQSFNPFYINKIKKIAPEFIRGILATDDAEEEKPLTRHVLKHMSANFVIKPDFISYRAAALPLSKRKTKNIPVIGWTVTAQEEATRLLSTGAARNIIFENFIPE